MTLVGHAIACPTRGGLDRTGQKYLLVHALSRGSWETSLLGDDRDPPPVAELVRPVVGLVVKLDGDRLAGELGEVDRGRRPPVLGRLGPDQLLQPGLAIDLHDELPVAPRAVADVDDELRLRAGGDGQAAPEDAGLGLAHGMSAEDSRSS